MLNIEIKSDISKTKGGKKLIDFIKAKYSECFYIAKNNDEKELRLKALDTMAFLDILINKIKDEEDGNDALKDLINVITDDDKGQVANNGDEPTQVADNEPTQVANENEPDYKAMFEAYKSENDNKLNALMGELESLKNPKKEPSEQELQREQYLKELGLDGLDEKLKRLEELDKKQKDKEEQDALIAKYAQVESELRKAYPDADLKAMAELATKLNGLGEGNIDSWKTLLNLVGKSNNAKKAEDLSSANNNVRTSDFNDKLKKGEVSEIDLGKELLSLV